MSPDESAVKISDYQTLLFEKKRLEGLIGNQKNIVRHDLDELKQQFKKEVKPALETASFVKRIVTRHNRKETIFIIAANLAIDIILKRILRNSNVLVQVLAPRIVKAYLISKNISLNKIGKLRSPG